MDDDEKRQQPRDSLFLMARCRASIESEIFRIKVLNLSASGLMADATEPPTNGESLQVEIRNIGWVEGRIVWVQHLRFGFAFDRKINPKAARCVTIVTDENPEFYFRRPLAVCVKAQEEYDQAQLRRI